MSDWPRTCVSCHLPCEPEDLPPGRRSRERSCWTCKETRAWEMNEARDRDRHCALSTWEQDGVTVRRCKTCPHVGPLATDFYAWPRRDGQSAHEGICKNCATRKNTERKRQFRDTPRGDAYRAREAAAARARRQRDPDAYHAAQKRWREKRKATMTREERARERELARIDYHLKAEREGRKITRHLSNAINTRDPVERVPVASLSTAIDRGMRATGNATALAQEIGITARTFRRWRSGEVTHVDADVAERLHTVAGLSVEPIREAA